MDIQTLLNKIVISDFNKKQKLIELVNKQDKNFYIVTTGIYENIYKFWNKIYENIKKYIPEKFNIIVHHYDKREYSGKTINELLFTGEKKNEYLTIVDINNYQKTNHIIIDFAHLFLYGMDGKKLRYFKMYPNPEQSVDIVYDNLNVVRASYPSENSYGYFIYKTSKLFEVNNDGKVTTLIDKIMEKSDFKTFYEKINTHDTDHDNIKDYYYEPLQIIEYLMEKYKGSNNTNKSIKILLEDKYATEKNPGVSFVMMDVDTNWFMEENISPFLKGIIKLLWANEKIDDIYNKIYSQISS
jgi:hypothetical protein